MRRVRVTMAVVALGAYILDQVTKYMALTHLEPNKPIAAIGDLVTLRLVFNPGAAFSLGENFTAVIAVFAILALSFVVVVLVPRVGTMSWAVAIGLIVCGIAGNLTDRLARPPGPLHGHVIDFLQIPYWPIFNVADICLVSGAVLVVWLSVVKQIPMGEPEPESDGEDSDATVTDRGDTS